MTDEAVVHGAIGSIDSLVNIAENIQRVTLTAGGANQFLQGIDYKNTGGAPDWSPNTVINIPANLKATASGLGGTLAAAAYTYVVTARKLINLTTNVFGETTQSVAVLASVVGSATGSVVLSWDSVQGATSYNVYRLSGTTYQLLATVTAPTVTYTDNGSASLTSTTNPPTSNNAYKQPAVGQTYFVTYNYRVKTFQSAKIYTSVQDVITDHGTGSQLAIMAELALEQPPRGQGCPAIMLIATANDADADFVTALQNLKFQLPNFIVPLRSTVELNSQIIQHCDALSNFRNKRERTCVLAPPATKPDGTTTADSDIASQAAALNFVNDFGANAGRRALFVSETSWQVNNVLQTDGTRKNQNLPGFFLAGATAARLCSLPDTATPLTNKVIFGGKLILSREEAAKDILATAGVCVIEDPGNGIPTVRQQLTAASINIGAFVEDQEFSIVITDDELAKNLRAQWRIFIGLKLSDRVLQGIRGATIRVLGLMKKQELIKDFDQTTIDVRASTVNPTFVLVSFLYKPMYPVNAVVGRYGFSLTG